MEELKMKLDIIIICMFVYHVYNMFAQIFLLQHVAWVSVILVIVLYYQMEYGNLVYHRLKEDIKRKFGKEK